MPTILERYELTAILGSGGMGTLWEGTDRRLGRPVVVKLIRKQAGHREADSIRRFDREARITARLGTIPAASSPTRNPVGLPVAARRG